MKGILLIGGGGHCASVADTLLKLNIYNRIGIVINEVSQPMFGTIPVVGCDEDLMRLHDQGYEDAFITVGSIGNIDLRRKLANLAIDIGFSIPCIVDPSAAVSDSASLERGVFVGKNAVINARSIIKDFAIINTAAVIEHDCKVGKFVHVSPSATLCGGVEVGADSHIGAASVIMQYLKIGSNSMVGMGSVVIKDVADNVTVFGNPARVMGDRGRH